MTIQRIDDDEAVELPLIDEHALLMAVETMRGLGGLQRGQIDRKLVCEPFFEAARFAAYYCQGDSLNLMPWEAVPSQIDDIEAALRSRDDEGKKIREAAMLLKQMLALGVSRYHPNPLHAITEAESKLTASELIAAAADPSSRRNTSS